MSRPLVVAAHGTASAEGRRVVEECAAAAAAVLGVPHAVGYVDVCGPTLEEALATSAAPWRPSRPDRPGAQPVDPAPAGPPIVVPLFLASGYHVRHDVPGAVSTVPDAVVTPALGVEPEVVSALADRVLAVAAGARLTPDAVVVTAAGSSVKAARAEVTEVATCLGERLGVPIGTAYLTGPGPRPEEEVARLRSAGHRQVVLATHLLSPGYFVDRAHAVAAELATVASEPLATHADIVALLVRRYREAREPAPVPVV